MGKVNLRNRLRENENEDNNSTNNISAAPNNNTNLIQTENNNTTVQPVNNGVGNSTPEQSSAEDLLFGGPDKKVKPIQILEKTEKNINNNISENTVKPRKPREFQKPPIVNNNEDSIFKDEEIEGNKFKALFKGTKGLFNKKDENVGVNNNIFERLNINKRMFYTASVSAAIASILIISYLNSFTSSKLFGSEMVNVLVANKNISEKAAITIEDLAQKEIPKKFVIPNAIILDDKVDPKSLVGQIALTDIYENEQIISKRVVKQEESPWLSPAVPINHRAFTIPSKALSYIQPRDHVDVLISLIDPLDKSRTINTAVLQNAIVLAVDGKYKVSATDTPTTGETVTIAVPNKLVNFFTILQEKGNFQLALRRDGDTTNLDTKYSIAQLEVMLNATDVRLEKFKPEPLVISTPKPEPKPKEVYVPTPQYEAPVYYNPPVYTPKRVQPRKYYPPIKPNQQVRVKPQTQVREVPKGPTTVFVINGTKVDTQTAPGSGAKK